MEIFPSQYFEKFVKLVLSVCLGKLASKVYVVPALQNNVYQFSLGENCAKFLSPFLLTNIQNYFFVKPRVRLDKAGFTVKPDLSWYEK